MTINDLVRDKKRGRKWAMMTAYDTPTAEILERAGLDWILVGDSLGMVVLGRSSTTEVTMDEMIHHAKAVRKGAPRSFLIGDMPLKGIDRGPRQALVSARRFLDESGCDAVKIEWAGPKTEETARFLTRNGVPLMGHVGLTPQTAPSGQFKVRGRTAADAFKIAEQAFTLEKLGVFSILLECVPSPVASAVSCRLRIPTIGIGAGPGCDGQVLVFHDSMGLFNKFTPRFVKRYAELEPVMRRAAGRYAKDVRQGSFPGRRHEFSMDDGERARFEALMASSAKKAGLK